MSSIPGSSGRSPGVGSGNSPQYSAWKIPWTEEPGGLQSMGSQRVRHIWATKQQTYGYYVLGIRTLAWESGEDTVRIRALMLGSETRHLGADCHDRAETYLQGTNFHLSLIVVMMFWLSLWPWSFLKKILIYLHIYLFIFWLHQVLIVPCRIFSLCCGMRNL